MYNDDYIGRYRNKMSVEKQTSAQSGDIIAQSLSKIDVLVNEATKAIPVAFINKDREFEDSAIMYAYKKDNLAIGDYVKALNRDYLIFAEIKNVKRENFIQTFNLIACNVNFTYDGVSYLGFFKGSARTTTVDEKWMSEKIGFFTEKEGLLVLPTSSLKRGSVITIQNKVFKIISEDSLSNSGISYFVLLDTIDTDLDKVSESESETPVQSPTTTTLYSGVDLTFATEQGYILTDKKVTIVSRTASSVVIRVPYGIDSITITVMEGGSPKSTVYEVL